jgi:hypothetical protein
MGAVTVASVAAMVSLLTFGDDDDKEQYRGLYGAELGNYIWLPNPFGKGLFKMRVPEQMTLFGTMINMVIADQILGAKYKVGDYIDAATSWIPDQFNVTDPIRAFISLIPQAVKPSMETVFNVKTWPDVMPLEGQSLQYKEPRARYYESTSKFAKALGDALNISPIKIDHMVEGYLGRTVRIFTGKNNSTPVFAILDLVKKAFIQDMYFTAGRNIRDYYDIRDENRQLYNALKNKERPFTKEETKKIIRNRAIINGGNGIKGIDDLFGVYRDIPKDQIKSRQKEINQLRSAILDMIALLER